MGSLFSTIGAYLMSAIGFQVTSQTNKFLFLGVLVTVYIGLYIAFVSTITGVIYFSPIQPTGNVAAGLSLLPSNIRDCMGAIGSAHVISHVVLMKSKVVKLGTQVV
jgi:hypothetical protein